MIFVSFQRLTKKLQETKSNNESVVIQDTIKVPVFNPGAVVKSTSVGCNLRLPLDSAATVRLCSTQLGLN